MPKEPFSRNEARKRLSEYFGSKNWACVFVHPHAGLRQGQRGLDMLDLEQILGRGHVERDGYMRNGRWRNELWFGTIGAVIQFEDDETVKVTVITVLRRTQ